MCRAWMGLAPILALLCGCGPDGLGGGPGAAHFRVTNRGHAPLYLEATPGPYWGLARGGQALRAVDACAVCNCGSNQCPPCNAANLTGKLMTLAPGAGHSWSWDGRVWVPESQSTGQPCERPELLAPGRVTVQVFHAASTRADASGTWLAGPRETTIVSFDHEAGVDVNVVLR